MKNWNQHAMEHHPEFFLRVMALVPQKTKECIQNEQNDGRKTKKQKTEDQDPEWTTEDTKKERKRPRNKKPTNGAKKLFTDLWAESDNLSY